MCLTEKTLTEGKTLMKSNLRSGKLRRGTYTESVNPMDGVANLADVMLVFALGLLLALIVSWNVDVGFSESMVSLEQGEELTEMDGMTESGENVFGDGSVLEEMGTVYKDPATGKLYMIVSDQ